MNKKLIMKGYGSETYEVTGITTETDEQILKFCDFNNFGGRVFRYGTFARVVVYID